MTRYIGLDAHATTCTFSVVGPNGKRLSTVSARYPPSSEEVEG